MSANSSQTDKALETMCGVRLFGIDYVFCTDGFEMNLEMINKKIKPEHKPYLKAVLEDCLASLG